MPELSFKFSEEALHRLDQLRFRLKVRDRATVVRQALRFLDYRVLEMGDSLPELEKELIPDTPEKWVVKRGPWQIAYFCAKCGAQLSYKVQMEYYGVCPSCGSYSQGTIETVKGVRRKVYTYIPRWWEWIFRGKRSNWHWEEKSEDPTGG